MISKNELTANWSSAMITTLSPFFNVNEMSLNKTLPSTDLESFSMFNTWLPTSRNGLKIMPGYLRLEGMMSSITSFSKAFLREVACLDFDAFALNRAMNSYRSFLFSSVFLFLSDICLAANWLLSYQKV